MINDIEVMINSLEAKVTATMVNSDERGDAGVMSTEIADNADDVSDEDDEYDDDGDDGCW